MATLRVQIATSADTVNPEDRVMITPHFVHAPPHTGLETFADDVQSRWATFCGTPWSTSETTIKIYDATVTTLPNYPLYEKSYNVGTAGAASINREVAMCLSYYAGFNRPRFRGRLYVPCFMAAITPSAARPTTTHQNKIGTLAATLQAMGGVDYQWAVWSRVDRVDRPVTNWWVDNAWDVQRRRGVKGTSRVTGTV